MLLTYRNIVYDFTEGARVKGKKHKCDLYLNSLRPTIKEKKPTKRIRLSEKSVK